MKKKYAVISEKFCQKRVYIRKKERKKERKTKERKKERTPQSLNGIPLETEDLNYVA